MVSEQIISTGLLHDFLSRGPSTCTVSMSYAKKLSDDCLRCLRQHKSLKANPRYFSALGPPSPHPDSQNDFDEDVAGLEEDLKMTSEQTKKLWAKNRKIWYCFKPCNYYLSRK